jgi:hypothetical protein
VHLDRAQPLQASSQLSHPVVFLPANIGALHGTEQVLGCLAGVSGGFLGGEADGELGWSASVGGDAVDRGLTAGRVGA